MTVKTTQILDGRIETRYKIIVNHDVINNDWQTLIRITENRNEI